ncbi:unnamed protein product [Amoebophrya sp. A120]|nr:unnamed protein product [Amoebophrya sp. A120]|eukprot:GSA120T00023654001.1
MPPSPSGPTPIIRVEDDLLEKPVSSSLCCQLKRRTAEIVVLLIVWWVIAGVIVVEYKYIDQGDVAFFLTGVTNMFAGCFLILAFLWNKMFAPQFGSMLSLAIGGTNRNRGSSALQSGLVEVPPDEAETSRTRQQTRPLARAGEDVAVNMDENFNNDFDAGGINGSSKPASTSRGTGKNSKVEPDLEVGHVRGGVVDSSSSTSRTTSRRRGEQAYNQQMNTSAAPEVEIPVADETLATSRTQDLDITNEENNDYSLDHRTVSALSRKPNTFYLPITHGESLLLVLLGILNGIEYGILNKALMILPLATRQMLGSSSTLFQMVFAFIWRLPPAITPKLLLCGGVLMCGGVLQGLQTFQHDSPEIASTSSRVVPEAKASSQGEAEVPAIFGDEDGEQLGTPTVASAAAAGTSGGFSTKKKPTKSSPTANAVRDDATKSSGGIVPLAGMMVQQRHPASSKGASKKKKRDAASSSSTTSSGAARMVDSLHAASTSSSATAAQSAAAQHVRSERRMAPQVADSKSSSFISGGHQSSSWWWSSKPTVAPRPRLLLADDSKTTADVSGTASDEDVDVDNSSDEDDSATDSGGGTISGMSGFLLQITAMLLSSNKGCLMQHSLQRAPGIAVLDKISVGSRTMTYSGITCLLLSFCTEAREQNLYQVVDRVLIFKLASIAAILCVMVCAELRLLQITSTVTFGVFGLLHSIPIVLSGVILFGDQVGLYDGLGFLVCLLGSYWYMVIVNQQKTTYTDEQDVGSFAGDELKHTGDIESLDDEDRSPFAASGGTRTANKGRTRHQGHQPSHTAKDLEEVIEIIPDDEVNMANLEVDDHSGEIKNKMNSAKGGATYSKLSKAEQKVVQGRTTSSPGKNIKAATAPLEQEIGHSLRGLVHGGPPGRYYQTAPE